MRILILFLVIFTVKAQPPSSQVDLPTGEVTTNFKPSLAVVIGVLAIMFSLTFVLLVFAKCCHRRLSSSQNDGLNQGLTRSRSRFSGIDKTVIESLPFFKFSSLKGARTGLECAVCLAKFEDIEILRLLPKCRHAFHIDCVDQWLEKHSSCPLCRQKVSTDDLKLLTYSNSLRFLSSHSDLRQDSTLELFVQREEDFGSGASRFSRGSSFKGKNEEEMPIRESSEEILDRFNHKIIISDVVLKNRWSSVSSSDLMVLNSEMINSMSSDRFSSVDFENGKFSEIEDGELVKIKEEMERKRVFEDKFRRTNQNDNVPITGVSKNGNTSKVLDPNEKRSMSEIVVHPRFTEFSMKNNAEDASCHPENNVKEERMRRLWLPIASRTVQWFANRERRPPPESQKTRQPFHVHTAKQNASQAEIPRVKSWLGPCTENYNRN